MTRPSWIGQTLDGRYRIDDILGQGGMSAVYKAYDPNLKRTVAVKMIHAHLADDPKFVVRFTEEAAAVAKLRHPNIVQVYDFNHEADLYYMVQEFVEGETLQERLRQLNKHGQRMLLSDAIGIILSICDAAGYAHQRGLIHRDIKPANIMINSQGQAILMDFGIVKIAGGEKHTDTGAVVGTALYLPPELVVGETPDPRSDEYSLAITLFEAVSGRPPFEADSAMTLMMMHLNDPVPDLRQLRTDVPVVLVDIIARALSKKREHRYPSMTEFANALRGVLASLETTPPVATLVDQTAAHGDPLATQSDALPLGALVPSRMAEPASQAASLPVSPISQSQSKPLPSVSPSIYSTIWFKLGCALGIFGVGLLGIVLIFMLLRAAQGVNSLPVSSLATLTSTATQPAATPSPSVLPSAIIPDANTAIPHFADPCLAGPDAAYPVLAQLKAGQVLHVQGISPDEAWWVVDHPAEAGQTCWLQRSRSDFTGDLSTLPLAEVPPLPADSPAALSVKINAINLDDQGHYVVDFTPLGFTPALPGMHMHFFFDIYAAEQTGYATGKRYIYGGASPFTDYTQADHPPEARQLCVLVANPDHTVIGSSGNCFQLPVEDTSQADPSVIRKASLWPVAFEDRFDNNQNSWPTGMSDSAEFGSINRRVENGRYRWEVLGKDPSVWWAASDQVSASDFYLAATVRQVFGSEVGEYGLIFRKNDDQDYLVYKISDNGQYALYLYQDEIWTALIDWSDTDSVLKGADNRMEVIAQGDLLYLYLNGDLVATLRQAVLAEGQAGLFVGTSISGDSGLWEFDNFEVRLEN